MPNVLLIGGRGNIGSGLRTYLPKFDPTYTFTSVDLPGAPDKATQANIPTKFIEFDICSRPDELSALMKNRDLVVYLARKTPYEAMNQMTDLVFETLLKQTPVPMVIGSSSIHAVDGEYSVDEGVHSILSDRRFDDISQMPDRMRSTLPATPVNPYAREKKYVEDWVQRIADKGHSAIAARWGGINAKNIMSKERGYFTLWCHQEDAAQFVHACYTSHQNGNLKSGAHYFVVSNNTYNIFDIEIQRQEIGYNPVHNSESFYE